jgi:hypothetical protein
MLDDAFLEWFRDATERAWAVHEPRTFEEVGGVDWQRGTRWLEGLSEPEIDEIERSWDLRFPPDYRLFLRRLHATDRPMRGALYSGTTLVPAERPGFYNWHTDARAIRGALEDVIGGLVFDVEHNSLWRDGWGPRPASAAERETVVRERVAAAPKLAPLFQHRALVLEPCRAGNPVLSIHQSDIIVYGDDLRAYLLAEFSGLLGSPAPATSRTELPFWGDFL